MIEYTSLPQRPGPRPQTHKGLPHAQIDVEPIPEINADYTQILGIQTTPIRLNDTMFIGKLGDTEFYVFQTSGANQGERTVAGYLTNPPGYDHLVFLTRDIEQIKRALTAHCVPIENQGVMPLPDGTTGVYCRFRDPEGNLIGVMQRVKC